MSIDNEEITKFAKHSNQWWNESGSFKMLHKINYLRVDYITKIIKKIYNNSEIEILDVGCGGGILTEKLAENSLYKVTGIDPIENNINVAKTHKQDLKIDYHATTIENFTTNKSFDVICIMEVLEHVSDLESFLKSVLQHLKKNGILFFSTINKNICSFIEVIILAEYILRFVPRKTHDWNKFIPPSTISKLLLKYDCKIENLTGIRYRPLTDRWVLKESNIKSNYIGYAVKC
ncbi:MAG: 3-demethylubiquinone-9 3-O-methyltransferase [Candidatus Xenolissoclinum pacificiensis L6]|uniref:Ubiquinone biosynthesis O-methyltransferase n=1 Tax=Candidatus Xenolissoclinum pacificiensis L6 TaxID=1401685 RepID=W2V0P8_9RICK|nr:MAG: 3-demethylubiquinone-9 3-O-methyltransferase [Candidatus Xenolissoclinum pacificiensis L6]